MFLSMLIMVRRRDFRAVFRKEVVVYPTKEEKSGEIIKYSVGGFHFLLLF